MNVLKSLTAAAALMALCGCFVLESARAPERCGQNADEHLIVYNYGWTLFGCIPLVCGNHNRDSWCPFAFFRDDVRHDYAMDWLKDHAKKSGTELRDVMCLDDRTVFFDFYYAPIPWVIQYREVNYSAMTCRPVKEERK